MMPRKGLIATALGLLATAALAFYVLVYTLVLKRTTTQNIVIGGGAGAIPPLVGWAAATGSLEITAFPLQWPEGFFHSRWI